MKIRHHKPFSTGQLLPQTRIKFAALPACHNQGKPSTGTYSYHASGSQLKGDRPGRQLQGANDDHDGHPWTKQ